VYLEQFAQYYLSLRVKTMVATSEDGGRRLVSLRNSNILGSGRIIFCIDVGVGRGYWG
jgi:hypothetical protein